MDIDLDLRWRTAVDGEATEIEDTLFALLEGVAAGGSLNHAAQAAGVSYRHAWGLVRDWEHRLGAPLVRSRRGRGASLTTFATALLGARADAARALQPALSATALRVSAAVEAAIERDRSRVRFASSHADLVQKLRDSLARNGHDVLLEIVGSEGALRHYRRGDADVAGFHLPLGTLGRTVAAKLIGLLDDQKDDIFLLEKRTLGLMSRPDQPVPTLDTLAGGKFRFVNRQPGSATRLTFDGLLGAAGIAPGDVRGYGDEEYTHTAVAALVVSRDADVAFGASDAANHFALAFEPMVEERFYLVVRKDSRRARATVAQ